MAGIQRSDARRAMSSPRPGSGLLRHLDAGLRPTLHDCASLMMIVSDNVATDLVLGALGGPTTVNRVLAGHGVTDAAITSPTVWALPPAQFGMATPRAMAQAWALLDGDDEAADLCRTITWRHQLRDGFARHVPFSPDLPDFGMPSPLRLWSKAGSYPTVSCEGGLFATDQCRWVLPSWPRRSPTGATDRRLPVPHCVPRSAARCSTPGACDRLGPNRGADERRPLGAGSQSGRRSRAAAGGTPVGTVMRTRYRSPRHRWLRDITTER